MQPAERWPVFLQPNVPMTGHWLRLSMPAAMCDRFCVSVILIHVRAPQCVHETFRIAVNLLQKLGEQW